MLVIGATRSKRNKIIPGVKSSQVERFFIILKKCGESIPAYKI
jgi:hypothetical protein